MSIILERYGTPKTGELKISLDISAQINISADDARRKVNGFLLNNVSYLIVGGKFPELVIGERIVWRVGVNHSLPGFGEIGRIGIVDVDAETGDIVPVTPQYIEEMIHRAKTLAASYPLQTSPAR
jgi:hypothetical protein